MDLVRKKHSSNLQTNLNGSELQRKKNFSKKVAEIDENELSLKKSASFSKSSTIFKKKILAENNESTLPDSSETSHLEITPQSKCLSCVNQSVVPVHGSPPSLHSYDPIINYTSPRPKYLRYNPNQRRELLQRIEGEKRVDEDTRSESSLSFTGDLSQRGSDSECEEEEELEEEKYLTSCIAWSLFLIFGVLLLIFFRRSSGSYPYLQDYENFAETIQGIEANASLKVDSKMFISEILMGSFMNISQICPNSRESISNLEANCLVSLNTKEAIEKERIREKFLIERINNDLSSNTEAFVTEIDDLLLLNRGLVENDSVVKEMLEKMDSMPLIEGECNANSSDDEYGIHMINCITSIESSPISVIQHDSSSLFTTTEDKSHNESLESIKTSLNFQSTEDENTLALEDQGFDESKLSFTHDADLEFDNGSIMSDISSKRVILCRIFISFGSLIVLVRLLSGFYKYFQSRNQKSLHVLQSEPSGGFCIEEETKETVKEAHLSKALDISEESKSIGLNAVSFPLDQMNSDFNESRIGTPIVKHLGDFTINGIGSKQKRIMDLNLKTPYDKIISTNRFLSPTLNKFDSSPYGKIISTNRMLSPTLDKFDSSSSLASIPNRISFEVVPADKGSGTSATSLRRSSRLRKRG